MNGDILAFFEQAPLSLPLYQALEERILGELEEVSIKVHKTQISFSSRHGFAYASLPRFPRKARPQASLILSFGLSHRLEHPRVWQAVEPYPRRWTHHVILQSPEDVDEELMAWIKEAYDFARFK